MMNGKLVQAEVLERKVFEAREKRLGPASFETCEAAALLADIRTDLGKLNEAGFLHRLALNGLIQSRGELDLDTLREFNNFGNCLKLMGKLDEAASMLRKAHECRNAHYGPKNQSTLRALDNLGTVLLDLGKVAEARKAHGTALEGMRELLGNEDLFTSRAALNLAAAHARVGEWSEATGLAGSAVLSLERTLGTGHIDTLRGAAYLGTVLRQSKQEDIALRILRRTSDLATDTLGKTHFVAAAREKELALIQSLTQTPQPDDAYRKKSFESILRKKRAGHEEVMTMLRRFKMTLIALAIIVLLISQWVLKTKLRRVPALPDKELVMKEREHRKALDTSGIDV